MKGPVDTLTSLYNKIKYEKPFTDTGSSWSSTQVKKFGEKRIMDHGLLFKKCVYVYCW